MHQLPSLLLRGVEFKRAPTFYASGINPSFIIFSSQPVAPHQKTLDKAILSDRLLSVGGAAWKEVAAGAVCRRDDTVVKANEHRSCALESCLRRLARGDAGRGEVAISSPGLFCCEGEGKEKAKSHN